MSVASTITRKPCAPAGSPAADKGLDARESIVEIAGLRTTVAGAPDAHLGIVLMHGYSMNAADLAPLAHSLDFPALFFLPEGPLKGKAGGRAWWEIHFKRANTAFALLPRDLANESPAGICAARYGLERFLEAIRDSYRPSHLIVGGYSQGGMLALDFVLRGSVRVDAIILMSTSRIALHEWKPQSWRLRGLPVFVSHGRTDTELAFSAGELLREFMLDAGAIVSWVPFDGGHEIPLIVWRRLRQFLEPWQI